MKQRKDHLPVAAFATAVTGTFVVALDLSIVNVAFPSISADFEGTTTATLSWVLSGYSVVFGALLLAGGRVADRSGRRRWFERGLLIFAVGSALCGVAPNAELLIAGRVVQAVGGAVLMPSSLALLLTAVRAEARAQAVALWGGVSALAVAAGPSIGAVVTEMGGWRWAFYLNLPLVGLALLGSRRHLAESSTGGPPPDLGGVALLCLGVGGLALGLTQGADWGWTSWRVVGAFVLAALAFPLAIRRAAAHPSPAVDLQLFRLRTAALANAAMLVYAVGFFAMLLSSVLFLTDVWGYSTLRAGLAITPGPLVVAVLARPAARLAGRHGYRPVLLFGAAAFTVGHLYYLTAVGLDPRYLADWLPGGLLVGVGVAFTFPVLSAAAVAALPAHLYAAGSALNQTARQIGGVLGVTLLVVVLGTPTTPEAALDAFRDGWLLCAGAAVASGAISALHRRQAEASPTRAEPQAVPA